MTGDTRGSGGGPQTSTRGDIVVTLLQKCLPHEWLEDLDLEGNLRLCQEAADSFRASPSFELLLELCLATRGAWNAIHDAWLYGGDEEGVLGRQAADRFRAMLTSVRDKMEVLPQDCVGDQAKLAEQYRDSIVLRHGLADLLSREGVARVYRELVTIARRRQGVADLGASIGHEICKAVSQGLSLTRAHFAGVAYEFLRHKLAILAAQLEMEHGPYAPSTKIHLAIAVRTFRPVAQMLERSRRELQDEGRIDRVGPFLAQLEQHLTTFQKEVCEPLDDIARRVPAGRAEKIDESFEAEGQACIDALRDFMPGFLGEVAFWGGQLERRLQKPMPLSVLVFQELGSSIAHCLEVDLVAQGPGEQEALADLAELIDVQFADMEGGEFEHPSPAPRPYFEAFDRGSECGRTLAVRHEGIGSITIRSVEASTLPPLDLICSTTE